MTGKMVLIACEMADRAVEVRSKLRSLQTTQAIDIDDLLVAIEYDLLGSARLIDDRFASYRTARHVKHAALVNQSLQPHVVTV